MSDQANQIVQRLWGYCNILRDDGLSYPDYVEQLTYLLFLKMAQEQMLTSSGPTRIVPPEFDWESIVSRNGTELWEHYSRVLKRLGNGKGLLRLIFHGAENKIKDPAKLELLVRELIDKNMWSALDTDVKGAAYEGLLDKNAQDTKSGAGQYFTPRPVIRAVVECVRPAAGETICDPACGTGGFLLTAFEYVAAHSGKLTPKQQRHLKLRAIHGVELVSSVSRLAAMNFLLHGIGSVTDDEVPIRTADSLAVPSPVLFDVVLTNPPFGKKSSITIYNEGGKRERQGLEITRSDFWTTTSNKQLNFLQQVVTMLHPTGRAAIVVPDNVLFEGGPGEIIRRRMLMECTVHTLLRLPQGIFYAQGVSANVLFFDRRKPKKDDGTLWVYDLRTDNRFTMRTNRLAESDLQDFVSCFKPGNERLRKPTWSPANPTGRWRPFSYNELLSRPKCSFDLLWLEPGKGDGSVSDPDAVAMSIIEDLRGAMEQIAELSRGLKKSKG